MLPSYEKPKGVINVHFILQIVLRYSGVAAISAIVGWFRFQRQA